MEEEEFKKLVETIRKIRKECPWDREQTHESMRKYLMEECFEVAEAIDSGDDKKLKEELGDLLIQVIFHSILAEEKEVFCLVDVLKETREKLVRRHPHVFGGKDIRTGQEVLMQWEEIKNEEGRESVLAGVPKDMPALLKAYRITEKAGVVGFDWKGVEDVWGKVVEEIGELRKAIDTKEGVEEEMGDVLFVLVNLSRHLGIDPEGALQKATERFRTRFSLIEKKAKERGINLREMSLKEMDEIWEEAKRKGEERNS
ncbi:MAG: nucleoside triphosphate pyrophosphohydrolase [bacterium]